MAPEVTQHTFSAAIHAAHILSNVYGMNMAEALAMARRELPLHPEYYVLVPLLDAELWATSFSCQLYQKWFDGGDEAVFHFVAELLTTRAVGH